MPLAFLLAAAHAQAPDGPHLWFREAVGVAAFPSGLISDTRVQLRAPLHRSDSILFRQTFAGVGARVAATPAFTAAGPRVSIAPIDVFDLDLQASWVGYYGLGGIGLLPYELPEDKLERDRSARADSSLMGGALQLSASPTLKLKLGPVIAFDSWTFSYLSIAPNRRTSAPYVYEPFSDLVVEWQEVTIEQQAAVVLELVPDEGGAFLWLGGTARDRRALGSGDGSTTAGVLIRGRPGRGAWPTLVQQTLFYVRDADRVGTGPNVALLAEWKLTRALD